MQAHTPSGSRERSVYSAAEPYITISLSLSYPTSVSFYIMVLIIRKAAHANRAAKVDVSPVKVDPRQKKKSFYRQYRVHPHFSNWPNF